MSECSQAKLDANRLNAQKSTGPRTADGKAIASANSLKHGFCAATAPVPGEDPQILVDRNDAWQSELNPHHKEAQGYIVQLAVRQTARLDRIHVASEARIAKRVRDVHKDRHNQRLEDVEAAYRTLHIDADIAVRRLRQTVEGCDYLIMLWESMRCVVELPDALFDAEDAMTFAQLQGRPVLNPSTHPNPHFKAAYAMVANRKLVAKIELSEPPHTCWDAGYNGDQFRAYDVAKVTRDAPTIEAYRVAQAAIIETEIAGLILLKQERLVEDALDRDEIEAIVKVGVTHDDQLMQRYETEAVRSLSRHLKELVTLNKQTQSEPQPIVLEREAVCISANVPKPGAPRTIRNEPIISRPPTSPMGTNESSKGQYATVPVFMTVDPDRKDRR